MIRKKEQNIVKLEATQCRVIPLGIMPLQLALLTNAYYQVRDVGNICFLNLTDIYLLQVQLEMVFVKHLQIKKANRRWTEKTSQKKKDVKTTIVHKALQQQQLRIEQDGPHSKPGQK